MPFLIFDGVVASGNSGSAGLPKLWRLSSL
jgi:hypothetical protein